MYRLLISIALLATTSFGCLPGPPEDDAGVRVFAAASLADVLPELNAIFATGDVRTSFGASSGLARQIEDGAPADVFVSANRHWMEFLQEGGLVGAPVVFAHNRLVCIAARSGATGPANAPELLLSLRAGDRVALSDEGVPAGDYARESLAATDDLEHLRPFLVGLDDVRSVLRAVQSGEAAAGFVYGTDARAGDVTVLFALDERTHRPIEYLAGVVRASDRPDMAATFLKHLQSDSARRVLVAAGFGIPDR